MPTAQQIVTGADRRGIHRFVFVIRRSGRRYGGAGVGVPSSRHAAATASWARDHVRRVAQTGSH
jgi:hypothetical protein